MHRTAMNRAADPVISRMECGITLRIGPPHCHKSDAHNYQRKYAEAVTVPTLNKGMMY